MAPRELLARIRAGAAPAVLDVRSAREFARGCVPGARHAPWWRLATGPLPIDPGEPAVVYCGHGPRAHAARLLLRLRGRRAVALLDGHFTRWRREGHPVERAGEAARGR